MKFCFPVRKKNIVSFSQVKTITVNGTTPTQILQGDSRRIAFIVTSPSSPGSRVATSPIPNLDLLGIPITVTYFDFFVMGKIGDAVKSEWYAANTAGNENLTIIEFLEYKE